MADETTQQEQAAQERPRAALADRHLNPEALMAASAQPNYLLYGILAIVSTIIFGVIVLLLWMEHTDLRLV